MWRLQYRNFGSHASMVGNFVVDVNGLNRGGIRWFEVRKVGTGAWTLHQEGTYAPDTQNRWMGASAMDVSGNIALTYSVSSAAVFPSLRYTGRAVGDPLGTMTIAETTIVAGGVGLLMVAATTLSLLPARDTVIGPALIVLGAGLLAGALNAAHIGAAANVAEATAEATSSMPS